MHLHNIGKLLNLNKYSFLKSFRITVYEENRGGGGQADVPLSPSQINHVKDFCSPQ